MADKAPWEVDDTAPWTVDDTAPAKPDRIGQVLKAATPKGMLETLKGLGEVGLQAATGTVGAAAGGLRGLGTLATGGGLDKAVQNAQNTQQALTYEPRLQSGKDIGAAINVPFEVANEQLGRAGGAVAGEAGRSIGENIIPVVGTLAGGASALGKARAAGAASRAGAAQEAADFARQNAGKMDALEAAQRQGIKVDPALVNPTPLTRSLHSVAGTDRVSNVLSRANESQWGTILKRDLDIDPKAPLDMETIGQVRQAAAAPMEEIRGLGTMVPDNDVIQGITSLRVEPTIGGQRTAGIVNSMVGDAVSRVEQGMTGAQVIDNISSLRKRARDIYKMPDAGPERLAQADASIGIANQLENLVENNLKSQHLDNPYQGSDTLLQRYREGRTRMAKSYVLEDALNLATGKVDPKVIAKIARKDNALTGGFADVGKIAENFPDIAKMEATSPHLVPEFVKRSSIGGTLGAGLGAMAAGPVGAFYGGMLGAGAGHLGSVLASRAYTSPWAQALAKAPASRASWEGAARILDEAPQPNPLGRMSSEVETGVVPFSGPNWQYYQEPAPRPQSGPSAPALPEFTAEEVMNTVVRQRKQDYNSAKAADVEPPSSPRIPAGEGQLLVQALRKGTELPKPSALERAVEKLAKGRAFDLTAEERIAWQKADGGILSAP